MHAQSPTLSPTLSATVAALRGSSAGMPCSTLPTRSAPTSAALVKMPPPTLMNIAMSAAPRPKPSRTFGASAQQTEPHREHADHAARTESDLHGFVGDGGEILFRLTFRRSGFSRRRGDTH